MITKQNVNKYLKIVLSSLWWCAIILLALLLINIISAKLRGEVPKVFGYAVMYITTGSMEEEIPVGSYILVRETAPEDIEFGDVICFYSEDPLIYGYPNTHRVVEEPIATGDGYEYVTRGDASSANDKINAKSERLIGKYVKTLTLVTSVLAFISTRYVVLLIIFIQAAFAVMITYSALINKRRRAENAKEQDEAVTTVQNSNDIYSILGEDVSVESLRAIVGDRFDDDLLKSIVDAKPDAENKDNG